ADDSRPQRGQVGSRDAVADDLVPQLGEGVGGGERAPPRRRRDAHLVASGLERAAGAGAEERVTRDALTLFDALEQERWVTRDLEVGGERGLEVGEDLAVNG